MLSERTITLCENNTSVSEEFARNPGAAPLEIAHRLYGHHADTRSAPVPASSAPAAVEAAGQGPVPQSHLPHHGSAKLVEKSLSSDEIEVARRCGQWGPTSPSDFFLQVYGDALACLEKDALSGMVSPSLMGSYGTMPLTVIAPLADIVRHTSNLIARAEREVILITCSWSPSAAQRLISDALKELSRRAGQRGQRVTVKVMYDKAGPSHAINNRQPVKPEVYSGKGVQLPKPEEMPNIDFEAINFHKPLLGTLHAKFVVVDRKIALLQSNNMEDNDNMEMGARVEGPIVDSLYDTALLTWGNAFRGSLPSSDAPASQGGLPTQGQEPLFMDRGPGRQQSEIVQDGQAVRLPEHMPGDPHYDPDLASEITRMQSVYSHKPDETSLQAANRQLNLASTKNPVKPSGPEIPAGSEFTPYIATSTASAFPIALVSRPPYGNPNNSDLSVPQNAAWLSCIRNAKRSIFIQTPNLNASPLPSVLKAALGRGVEVTYYVCLGYNDAGEIMPGQGGTNEMFAGDLMSTLSPDEQKRLHIGYYVGKDQSYPIHHNFRARSCHIKLLIADDHIGIMGSGNQDTQSWFHSQEINVMIDSAEVCAKWREGIERNQNTAQFGMTKEGDPVWRDQDGKEAEGSLGRPSAPMSWVKGVIGMAKKAQEKGGLGG